MLDMEDRRLRQQWAAAHKPVADVVCEPVPEEVHQLVRALRSDSRRLEHLYGLQNDFLVAFLRAYDLTFNAREEYRSLWKTWLPTILGVNHRFVYKTDQRGSKSQTKTAVLVAPTDVRFTPPELQPIAQTGLGAHLFNVAGQGHNLMTYVMMSVTSITIRVPRDAPIYTAETLPAPDVLQTMLDEIAAVRTVPPWDWTASPQMMAHRLNLLLYTTMAVTEEAPLCRVPAMVGASATPYGYTEDPGVASVLGVFNRGSKWYRPHFERARTNNAPTIATYDGRARVVISSRNEKAIRSSSTEYMSNPGEPHAVLDPHSELPFPRTAKVSAWEELLLTGCTTIEEAAEFLWPNGQSVCGRGPVDPMLRRDLLATLRMQQHRLQTQGVFTREHVLKSLPWAQHAQLTSGNKDSGSEFTVEDLVAMYKRWNNSVLEELHSQQTTEPTAVGAVRKTIGAAKNLCMLVERLRGMRPDDVEDDPSCQRLTSAMQAIVNVLRVCVKQNVYKPFLSSSRDAAAAGATMITGVTGAENNTITAAVGMVVSTGSASVSRQSGSNYWVQTSTQPVDATTTHHKIGAHNQRIEARAERANTGPSYDPAHIPDNMDGAARQKLTLTTRVRQAYPVELLMLTVQLVLEVDLIQSAPDDIPYVYPGCIHAVGSRPRGAWDRGLLQINYRYVGWLRVPKEVALAKLLHARRHGPLPRDVTILADGWGVNVLGDQGSTAFPALRTSKLAEWVRLVEQCRADNALHVAVPKAFDAGFVEYLTSEEITSLGHSVALDLHMLCRRPGTDCEHWGDDVPLHTHLLLHPCTVFGFGCAATIHPQTCNVSRIGYGQAMTSAAARYTRHLPFWTTSLLQAQRPLVGNPVLRAMGPQYASQQITMALMFDSMAQDDSVRMATEAHPYLLAVAHSTSAMSLQNPDELFCNPAAEENIYGRVSGNFGELGEDAVIREGAHVMPDTVLVGKVRREPVFHPVTNAQLERRVDQSKLPVGNVEADEVYRVQSTLKARTAMKDSVVIKVFMTRVVTVRQGSKQCISNQKFTDGPHSRLADMPFNRNGQRAGVTLNMACVKRQTNNLLLMMALSIITTLTGEEYDGTAFTPLDFQALLARLRQLGVPFAKDRFMDPKTGRYLGDCDGTGAQRCDVFFAPVEIMRMPQTAAAAAQVRDNEGRRSAVTGQPRNRRVHQGGMRTGQSTIMALLQSCAASVIIDAIDRSGTDRFPYCSKCGRIGVNPPVSVFQSMMRRGVLTPMEEAVFLAQTLECQRCVSCGAVCVCVVMQPVIYALHCLLTLANIQIQSVPDMSVAQADAAEARLQQAMALMGLDTLPVPGIASGLLPDGGDVE